MTEKKKSRLRHTDVSIEERMLKPLQHRPRKISPQITPELADEVIARLQERSLKSVTEDDDMPSADTIRRWVLEDDGFAAKYERATKARAQRHFDEILEIADQEIFTEDAPMANVEINRRKLAIDARKWIVARMDPGRFAEKMLTEHTGAGGGPVVFKTVFEKIPDWAEERMKEIELNGGEWTEKTESET